MLASAFASTGSNASTDIGTTTAGEATATPAVSQALSSDHPLTTIASVEAYVREYYKDTPILAEIARCESSFRQFAPDGSVIRGKVNKGDLGVMQINKYYHEDDAAKLGYDLYTIDGNLAYARHLYEKYGTDPWSSSSKCWKASTAYSSQIAIK